MDTTNEPAYVSLGYAFFLCLLIVALQLFFGILFGASIFQLPKDQQAVSIFVISLISLNAVLFLVNRKDRSLSSRLDLVHIKKLKIEWLLPIALVAVACAVVNGIFDKLLSENIETIARMNQEISSQMGDNIILLILFVAVINPIFEEAFFRGYLVPGMARRYGRLNTVVFVAVLFGVIHLNPTQIISAFVFGLVLNWVMLDTNNLYYAILAHCLYNFSALMHGGFLSDPSLQKKLILFHIGQANIDLIDLCGLLALGLGLLWYAAVRKTRHEPVPPENQ